MEQMVRVGVAAYVVNENDEYLLLCRKGSHGSGQWCVPGGHQEFGETPEQTAEREMFEESGIVVKAIQPIGFTNDIWESESKHYITLGILTEYVSGTAQVMEPDKASDIGWFTLENAKKLDLFEPTRKMFKILRNSEIRI